MGWVARGAKNLAKKSAQNAARGVGGAISTYIQGGKASTGAAVQGAGSGVIGTVIRSAVSVVKAPPALVEDVARVIYGERVTKARIDEVSTLMAFDRQGNQTDLRNAEDWYALQVQIIGDTTLDDDATIHRRASEYLNASFKRLPGGWFEFAVLSDTEKVDAVVRETTRDAIRSIKPLPGSARHPRAEWLPVSDAEALDLPTLTAKVERHFPGQHIHGFIPRADGGYNVELAPSTAPEFFNADVLELGPSAKAEWVDAYAQGRATRQRLIHFDATRGKALVATLDPMTETLRDRTAEILKARPWDVQLVIRIAVEDDGQGRVDEIEFTRLPNANADSEKRLNLLAALRDLIPGSTEHWEVSEDALTGRAIIAYRADRLLGSVAYDWDAPVSMKSIPFGVTEHGDPLALGLLESNALLGGIPGSGKSGGATALLAGISRLESTALIGLDPKRVELSPWKERFSVIAKTDDHASFVLASVEAEMERRYTWLDENGLKKFSAEMFSPERPLLVVFIDELADLVSVGVTKEEKDQESFRSTRVRRLIAKGRAAGVVVVTATQKPQSDVIPTALRDLIQQRVGFATTNAAMTETILGAGMAQNGGLSHQIAASEKGVCFVVNEESRVPVRARAAWIPDEDVAGIAAQTAHLRIPLGWLPTEDDTAEAVKRVDKDTSWSDLLPDANRFGGMTPIKPGERMHIPAPDQSVFTAWDNRFLHADSSPQSAAQETIQLPEPSESDALDPNDLFNERNPHEQPDS